MLNCCVKAKISGQTLSRLSDLTGLQLFLPQPFTDHGMCRCLMCCSTHGDLLRDVRELLLACYCSPHFPLGVKAPWNIWCMQMNKQVNDQKLSVQEEKKKSIVLSFLETCYGQISSSSSQVCSIKYITQSTRIYKAYCKSNLPRQVVFNYPYHFQERNILNI